MNATQRRKFQAMALRELRKMRDDLVSLISDLERGPVRDIDVATAHTGDPAMIARVLRVIGDPAQGKWDQVERIYCSLEKCPACPHGDFRFRYQRNKKRKKTSVKYMGKMAFDYEVLERLKQRIRGPIAAFEIRKR